MAGTSKLTLDSTTKMLAGRMWRAWVRPQWRRLILAFALMGVVVATTTAYPIIVKWAFDMLEAKDTRVITLIPPLVIAVVIVKSISLYFQTVVTGSIVLRVVQGMQEAMFGRLLTWDLGRLNRDATGSFLSRFTSDTQVMREALTRVLTNSVRDLLTLIGLIGTMFYFDWMLSLMVLVIYPIAAVPVINIGKRMRRDSADTQAHVGDMTALLNESLSGARMVKTYGLEAYEKERAEGAFRKLFNWNMRLVRGGARVDPTMEMLGGVAVAGVFAFGGWRILDGTMTVGDLVGLISALLMAGSAARAVGTLNVVAQQGFAAVQRVFELLDEQPEIVDAPHAKPLALTKGRVSLDGVTFAYEPGAPAIADMSLDIEPGHTVALVGPSGAGKSTVINLIPRLYDADAGHVRIDGQDVKDVTLASLRAKLALVSQDVTLFNDTVRANIAFGRLDASEEEIIAAAKAAAAHEFIEAMPEGYDTVVGDRGVKLSGGQRQRIALARAVLRDAPILLLDEATSALDAESERRVQEALDHLREGRTTIVIAHRLATVREADLICVMEQGRIVEQGTHDALIAQGGLYARLCKMQYFADDKVPEAAQ